MFYSLLKRYLFRMDAEDAHDWTLRALGTVQSVPGLTGVLEAFYRVRDSRLEQELLGVDFPNPVGLAAGFDKNARVPEALEAFGFGFLELGGVTAVAQPGNPRPRMFRLPRHRALINRMGFNNEGAEAVRRHLRDASLSTPTGVNIGKSKDAEDPADDYRASFVALRDHADYFVVNVSSPNTPGLRTLQQRGALESILETLQQNNPADSPLLVKVSPDLTESALDDVVEVVLEQSLDGIIAVNTTTSRASVQDAGAVASEPGGLSGAPLRDRAHRLVSFLYRRLPAGVPIIGVGGILSSRDAVDRIRAGASLIQLYTGLVYEGPGLVRRIQRGIVETLEREGYDHVRDLVGTRLC